MLVSVTAEGLTESNSICPPQNDTNGAWTQVDPSQPENFWVSGTPLVPAKAITQASFWSFRTAVDTNPFTFTFEAGACATGTQTPVLVSAPEASVIAVRYTGVDKSDPINDPPIDQAEETPGVGDEVGYDPNAPSIVPPQYTTYYDDRIVYIWGSGAASFDLNDCMPQYNQGYNLCPDLVSQQGDSPVSGLLDDVTSENNGPIHSGVQQIISGTRTSYGSNPVAAMSENTVLTDAENWGAQTIALRPNTIQNNGNTLLDSRLVSNSAQ